MSGYLNGKPTKSGQVALVLSMGGLHLSDIADRTGLSLPEIHQALKTLRRKGRVHRVGPRLWALAD